MRDEFCLSLSTPHRGKSDAPRDSGCCGTCCPSDASKDSKQATKAISVGYGESYAKETKKIKPLRPYIDPVFAPPAPYTAGKAEDEK